MSTIPADPTMVLGQLVSRKKLKQLEDISKAMEPQIQARDKYDALSLAVHNLEGIFRELSNMGVDKTALESMEQEIKSVKTQTSQAAIALGKSYVTSQKQVTAIKTAGGSAGKIGVQPESPYDMTTLVVKGQPVSMDSMHFDVQFFRNEEQSDRAPASVSDFIYNSASSMNGGDKTRATEMSNKSMKATEHQYSNHTIEGTLVIVCQCTHKIANFVEGLLDAEKAINAWNITFPEDPLQTDAASLMEAALEKTTASSGGGKGGATNKKALQLLTGQTFGSTFVGLAHILETETTESSSRSSSKAFDYERVVKDMKKQFAWEMQMREMEGKFGVSDEFAESIRSSLSKTTMTAHCSILCQGAVPDIVSSEKKQFLSQQKPSTLETLEKVRMINASKDPSATGTDGTGARTGGMMMHIDGNNLQALAGSLDQKETSIKVIDIDSMLASFKNYLDIVKGENKWGENVVGGGVPLNFYLKELDKKAVAKLYLQKFYPNGISSAASVVAGNLSDVSDTVKLFLGVEGFL